jgi:hypothetical protein
MFHMITPYDGKWKLLLKCEAHVVHKLVPHTDNRFIYIYIYIKLHIVTLNHCAVGQAPFVTIGELSMISVGVTSPFMTAQR